MLPISASPSSERRSSKLCDLRRTGVGRPPLAADLSLLAARVSLGSAEPLLSVLPVASHSNESVEEDSGSGDRIGRVRGVGVALELMGETGAKADRSRLNGAGVTEEEEEELLGMSIVCCSCRSRFDRRQSTKSTRFKQKDTPPQYQRFHSITTRIQQRGVSSSPQPDEEVIPQPRDLDLRRRVET